MADVSRPRGAIGGRDRGQLILVAGILMAITMVALVLLVNTAIYAENLATRGVEGDGREALTYQRTVHTGVAGIVARENGKRYSSHAAVATNVSAGIEELDGELRSQRVLSGAAVNVSNRTLHEGAVLRQTDSGRNLTPVGGLPVGTISWTLAQDVTGTRRFVIDISGGLQSTSTPGADAFRVTLIGAGANQWELYLYRNASDGDTTEIAVKNGTAATPTRDVCSPAAAPEIDLVNGTVDGTPCSAIAFAKGISAPYDVHYRYGNRSTGTYELTANVSQGAVQSGNFNDPGGSSPVEIDIVYRATLDVSYETTAVRYRARLLVDPGGNG